MQIKKGDSFSVFYQVTEKIYKGFMELFDDRNPLHTDEQYAREKKFSGKVMHGAILTGFLSNFIGEQLPVKNVVVLSYSISYLKPVYLEDKVELLATVDDLFESVNCAAIKFQFKNSQGTIVSKGDISIKIV